MAKNKDEKDIVIENLHGFIRKGAASRVAGNVPTGHFILDFVIHHGVTPDKVDLNGLDDKELSQSLGLPRGKLIEIFGEEGSGKSSIAYRVVGYGQKLGLPAAWIDTENSFADDLAKINGVDKELLYYANMCNETDPDKMFYAEDVFDAIIQLCKSGVKIIILDSVADLVSKERMEASAEKVSVGKLARLMSENLGKIMNYASLHGVLVIFINQLREKIGIQWGNPETSPGGHSLKHNASLRIQLSKKGKESDIYKENDEDGGEKVLIGRKVRVNIRKNRFAKPYIEPLEIPIYYEPYFPDIEEMLFDVGRQLKIISVRKMVYTWKDDEGTEHKIEGKKAFIDYIKSMGLQFSLAKNIVDKAKEDSVLLPPEITQWYRQRDTIDEEIRDSAKKQTNEGTPSGRRKGKNSEVVADNPGGET